jgi:Holliday junction resolvasome RuvABC DNA-binding subunit
MEGFLQKELKTVITFDCVTEPGIEIADKWHSPALESLASTAFIFDDPISINDQDKLVQSLESLGYDWQSIHNLFSQATTQAKVDYSKPIRQPTSIKW